MESVSRGGCRVVGFALGDAFTSLPVGVDTSAMSWWRLRIADATGDKQSVAFFGPADFAEHAGTALLDNVDPDHTILIDKFSGGAWLLSGSQIGRRVTV